jgi:hypothetical protein
MSESQTIPELQKFRQKYPYYNDLDDSTLAAKLAAKYPAVYGDLPGRVEKFGKGNVLSNQQTVKPDTNFSQNNFFQPDTNDLATRFTKGKNALAPPDITFKPGSQGSGSHYAPGTTYTLPEVVTTANRDTRPAIAQSPLKEREKHEFRTSYKPITDFYGKEKEQYERLADLSEAVHDLTYGQKGLGTFNPFGQFMGSIKNAVELSEKGQGEFNKGETTAGAANTLLGMLQVPFQIGMMTNPVGFAWQQGEN